jgi:hypothetical protein
MDLGDVTGVKIKEEGKNENYLKLLFIIFVCLSYLKDGTDSPSYCRAGMAVRQGSPKMDSLIAVNEVTEEEIHYGAGPQLLLQHRVTHLATVKTRP